jgi:oligogalacturonide lyase
VRFSLLQCFAALAAVTSFVPVSFAADASPSEWIDPQTGHRVVRLSREPGTASLYFHQNAYTPDGKKLIVTRPGGISTIDLATREIAPVVDGDVNVIVAGRKTGDIYYTKADGAGAVVYATNPTTHATRQVAKLARGRVSSVNADETLLLGQYSEGAETRVSRGEGAPRVQANTGGNNPTFQANYSATWPDGRPMTYAEAKDLSLHNRLMAIRQGPPQVLFTVNIATGETKEILSQREWLGHLQFSPTDPQQLMFCHEGTWHEVDRVWLLRADGSGLTKVHARTMNMEIAGHEFFSADGRTVWYDLQTPRGEDFWLGSYTIATGKRTWFHLQRDEWSVHFNVSPDGSLFCGDGGDEEMVAHAKNGKWIYLFRPERVPDVAGIRNPNSENLIDVGVFRAERLVDMSKHNYLLEPNVSFTPDMKWIVFRSNMSGVVHTYAVEVAKAK